MEERIAELNEQLAELGSVVNILAQTAMNDSDEEYFQKNIYGSLQHIKKELERLHTEYYNIECSMSKDK